jgi:hypothetical protein
LGDVTLLFYFLVYPDKGNPHISQLSFPAGFTNVQCLQDAFAAGGGAAADVDDPIAVFEFALAFPSNNLITQTQT